MGRSTFEATHSPHKNCLPEGLEQLLIPQVDNSRIVALHGDVTEHTVSQVIAQLLNFANTNRNPVYVIVSTYGGAIDEMFALYDTIKFLPCPVHTVGLGKVMSAGVLLLAAGIKGKRLIGNSARIMVHPVSGGVYGNVFEVENETKEHRRLHNLMLEALAKETKMDRKKLEEIMNPSVDYFLTAQEAISLGIVDKVIGDHTNSAT